MYDEKRPLLKGNNSGLAGKWRAFRASLTPHTLTVLLYAMLYVVSGVVNSVLLKKVMISFTNYSFYLKYVPLSIISISNLD